MSDQHKQLVIVQKQLIQLQSNDADDRFTACEELRLLPTLPDHAIEALREKINDPNPDVADAATRAIDLHRPQSEPVTLVVPAKDIDSNQGDIEKMYKSIRSWAILLVIIGGISIITGGTLDPVWGIVLIVIGVLSWRIKIPQLFLIYSVTMGWAAISNTLAVFMGESLFWLGLVFLQVYLTFKIIQEYRQYRNLPLQEIFASGMWLDGLAPPQKEDKIVDRFAISSLVIGVISILIMSVTSSSCLILFLITDESYVFPEILFIVALGAVNLAVLALGLGCAALVSTNNRRNINIAGVVLSSLVLISYIGGMLLMLVIDRAVSGSYPVIDEAAKIIFAL